MATRAGRSATEPATLGQEDGQASAAQVLRRFRQVFNAVKTHFQQVEKQVGVGGAQVWALSVIQECPDIGISDLARAMDIHQSTASNLVKILIERELVAAAKGETDRRSVRLRVRPAGARLLKLAPGPFTGVLPIALQSLDAATLQRLNDDLGQLIEALHADKRGAKRLLADM